MNRILTQLLAALLLAQQLTVNAQLNEIERVCDQIPCADSETANIQLTCGNSGERIVSVIFASFGEPVGVCPVIGQTTLGAADFNFSSTPGCDLSNSVALIESACVGQVSCNIDVAAVTSGLSSGLDNCTGGGSGNSFSVAVQCQDQFNAFGLLSFGVIALIGFALGATITVEMFKNTFKEHGRAVIVGWSCQFGFMPLVAYLYVLAFEVDPLVALGVILTGSVPGGTTSNLLTYYAKGNVALSIIMSVASTFCALFMLPLLLFLYGTLALGFTGSVAPPFTDIFVSLAVVIVPVSLGVLIRQKNEEWAKRVEVVGSILGVLFLLAALVLGIVQNPDLFDPSKFQKTWIGAAFFQPVGTLLGWGVAKLFRLSGPELRAVVLETGVQNYTIAIAVAGIAFTGCRRSIVLTFILAASFWYIINSLWITGLLRWSSKFDSEEDQKEAKESHIMP